MGSFSRYDLLVVTPLQYLMSSRLFYLYQESMMKIIREESLFTFLSWISVSFSGVVVALVVGDNFFNAVKSRTLFNNFGSCLLWEHSPFSYDSLIVLSLSLVLFTSVIQIVLFFKHRQLEKQRARGIMVVTYNRDGVTISSRSVDQPLCRKLSNFNRTVVTPKASFLAFLSNLLRVFIHILIYKIEGPPSDRSDPSIFTQFIIYLEFCVLFFIFTLIETIFSPTLLNTLIDYMPCHRQAYIDVIV